LMIVPSHMIDRSTPIAAHQMYSPGIAPGRHGGQGDPQWPTWLRVTPW
jgi:hypothetical protein